MSQVVCEGEAVALELGLQLGEVVELAVVGDPVAAVRVRHRLGAARGRIDDRQAAVAERRRKASVLGREAPDPVPVRPAVRQRLGHSPHERLVGQAGESADAAHGLVHRPARLDDPGERHAHAVMVERVLRGLGERDHALTQLEMAGRTGAGPHGRHELVELAGDRLVGVELRRDDVPRPVREVVLPERLGILVDDAVVEDLDRLGRCRPRTRSSSCFRPRRCAAACPARAS